MMKLTGAAVLAVAVAVQGCTISTTLRTSDDQPKKTEFDPDDPALAVTLLSEYGIIPGKDIEFTEEFDAAASGLIVPLILLATLAAVAIEDVPPSGSADFEGGATLADGNVDPAVSSGADYVDNQLLLAADAFYTFYFDTLKFNGRLFNFVRPDGTAENGEIQMEGDFYSSVGNFDTASGSVSGDIDGDTITGVGGGTVKGDGEGGIAGIIGYFFGTLASGGNVTADIAAEIVE